MELNENAQIDTSQIDDQRGSGGGGGFAGIPIPIGGGGGVVGLIVFLVLAALGGGGYAISEFGDEPTGDNRSLAQRCAQPDRLEQLDCRNTLFVNSIQDYWRDALPQHFNAQYRPAQTNFFSGAVRTACGAADSGVGPFYCPANQEIYIDLSFYRLLAQQLGARGEFAQPYVLAHEYGHHVQTLLGTESDVRRQRQRDPSNANELSVRLELQADCFAGAWAKNATSTDDRSGAPLFKSITDQDIQDGLATAAAIGDDTLQRRGGGNVNEEAFTHGTSQQRQNWFRRGYETGDPTRCDTFNADQL